MYFKSNKPFIIRKVENNIVYYLRFGSNWIKSSWTYDDNFLKNHTKLDEIDEILYNIKEIKNDTD